MNTEFNNTWLPNKDKLQNIYQDYQPHISVLLNRLEEFLKSLIKIDPRPSYKGRVKNFESYFKKLRKYPPENPETEFPLLTDIIGIRVVCSFLHDLKNVEKIITDNFVVLEIEKKGSNMTFSEFGYESTHFLLKIPEQFKVGLRIPEELIFEIQLRTLSQEAWAEVEHELAYKAEFSPTDIPLKRKLASINASLSLADIIFQEIRDYQNKLNTELDKRRTDFYSKVDEYTSDILQDAIVGEADIHEDGMKNSPKLESVDDLIFAAIKAHNNNNFEFAKELYTKIIDQKPNDVVLSVVHKHRGMASFAQGDYLPAYEDFIRSFQYNKDNFRAYYYAGIVLTLLNRDREAIDLFTQSLEINKYQAHVYFRRSLAYYKAELYTEACLDLDKADALGLNKEDVKKLRSAIAKKMDIV